MIAFLASLQPPGSSPVYRGLALGGASTPWSTALRRWIRGSARSSIMVLSISGFLTRPGQVRRPYPGCRARSRAIRRYFWNRRPMGCMRSSSPSSDRHQQIELAHRLVEGMQSLPCPSCLPGCQPADSSIDSGWPISPERLGPDRDAGIDRMVFSPGLFGRRPTRRPPGPR